MKVTLFKSTPSGTISAPPSKSYTHRYLIASMLSNDLCKVSNIYLSDDIKATLNCLASFGCDYEIIDNNVIIKNSNKFVEDTIFDCNESGSTLRFLIPIVLTKYEKATFKGSKRLLDRGLSVYEDIFKKQNIKIIKDDNKITFIGKLKADTFIIDNQTSSQYVTGLLFALPLLESDSVIQLMSSNSSSYIDITLDVLNKFNIKYLKVDNKIFIYGNQKYKACNNVVEGDYSNAAFLKAFNYLNGSVIVNNLNKSSFQGDKVFEEYFLKLSKENITIDISNCIDLGPVLFAFASIFNGATFLGTNRLKIKESDRASSMAKELLKINVKVDVLDDKVIVYKSNINNPIEEFNSHNDHRIAMALSIFSSIMDVTINGIECISKSYPNYLSDLESLGVKMCYENQ